MFGKDADKIILQEDGSIKFRKEIGPSEIVASIRSLNDSLKWDYPDVVNLLKPTRVVIKNILKDEYGKSHPVALSKYELANEDFAKGAQMFSGDQAKWKKWKINSTSTPEQLANDINSVKKLREFNKKAFHHRVTQSKSQSDVVI